MSMCVVCKTSPRFKGRIVCQSCYEQRLYDRLQCDTCRTFGAIVYDKLIARPNALSWRCEACQQSAEDNAGGSSDAHPA